MAASSRKLDAVGRAHKMVRYVLQQLSGCSRVFSGRTPLGILGNRFHHAFHGHGSGAFDQHGVAGQDRLAQVGQVSSAERQGMARARGIPAARRPLRRGKRAAGDQEVGSATVATGCPLVVQQRIVARRPCRRRPRYAVRMSKSQQFRRRQHRRRAGIVGVVDNRIPTDLHHLAPLRQRSIFLQGGRDPVQVEPHDPAGGHGHQGGDQMVAAPHGNRKPAIAQPEVQFAGRALHVSRRQVAFGPASNPGERGLAARGHATQPGIVGQDRMTVGRQGGQQLALVAAIA